MNAREFCREPGFPLALLLTWSFDAVFFERVVLQDLASGGTRLPLVLADRGAIAAAQDRWPGQVQHLGRRYVLEASHHDGHFHPKLMLRLGPNDGRVWLSTGNLSPAGLGGNQELGAAWRIGPGHPDTGLWVGALLREATSWCLSPASREGLQRLAAVPWLQGPEADMAPLLWTRPGATLAQQLATRWQGRKFDTVALMTGSTDASGAFLNWAQHTFGVRTALIAVQSSRASFDPDQLEKLGLAIRFIEPPGAKPLHAKCYWFDGPEGPASLFGSPNCSASAWVRPLEQGGNTECMAVFDHPERLDWAPVLALFQTQAQAPRAFLLHPKSQALAPEAGPSIVAVFIELDRLDGLARCGVAPEPPPGAIVTLLVGGERVPLRRTVSFNWEGPLPECAGTGMALFGSLEITSGESVVTTPVRWVDQRHEQREAARDNRAANVLFRLTQPMESREQRMVLGDLQLAMNTILAEPAEFPDTVVPPRPAQAEEPPNTPGRLDPERMTAPLSLSTVATAKGKSTPMTFYGVINVFFALPGDAGLDQDQGLAGNEGGLPPPPPEEPPATRPAPPVRARLTKQIETYLQRLEAPAFAQTCTATQMVQAIAFPIAIASLGAESGWVTTREAQAWTTQALAALLYQKTPDGSSRGLLAFVGKRYQEDGRKDTFSTVAGDGALWTVAAVALAGLAWSGIEGKLQRALLIRDGILHPVLIGQANSEVRNTLSGRLRNPAALKAVLEDFPQAVATLVELEKWLAANYKRVVEAQTQGGGRHEVNDPLWSPQVGWVLVQEAELIRAKRNVTVRSWHPEVFASGNESRVRSCGYFINVRLALAQDATKTDTGVNELKKSAFYSGSL